MATKCNSCGGTYNQLTPDGSRYFHHCWPEEITTRAVFSKSGELEKKEERAPRQNIRNENVHFDPQAKEEKITSEGLGTTEV